MPRRSILSATERDALLAIPEARDELIRLYTLSDAASLPMVSSVAMTSLAIRILRRPLCV